MPDHTVTLPEGDWQVVRAALYELPIKIGLSTLQRFEIAVAQPQAADNVVNPAIPRLVESSDG